MALYNGPTPKRHVAWSNSAAIALLDLGRLEGWTKKIKAKEAQGEQPVKLVRKYVDKNGKQRYHGSKQLRASESGTYWFSCFQRSVTKVAMVDMTSEECQACPNSPPRSPLLERGTIQKTLAASSYLFSNPWWARRAACQACQTQCPLLNMSLLT